MCLYGCEMEQPDDGYPIALQQVECELFGKLAASFESAGAKILH